MGLTPTQQSVQKVLQRAKAVSPEPADAFEFQRDGGAWTRVQRGDPAVPLLGARIRLPCGVAFDNGGLTPMCVVQAMQEALDDPDLCASFGVSRRADATADCGAFLHRLFS